MFRGKCETSARQNNTHCLAHALTVLTALTWAFDSGGVRAVAIEDCHLLQLGFAKQLEFAVRRDGRPSICLCRV